jgi:acetoin utilization deacetylase AcuC-like enzyme
MLILGNGVEDGFKDDESLFYGSTHQINNFPYTGKDPTPFIGDSAKTAVDRRIVNREISAGRTSSEEFRSKWKQVVDEMILFQPNLVFISAGFDAHIRDPLAMCELTDDDYIYATQVVLDACAKLSTSYQADVPIISVLEGGYDIEAVGSAATKHVKTLFKHRPFQELP